MSKDLREESRKEYTVDRMTTENLRTGAILRIADSVEKMAAGRVTLENRLNYWKEKSERYEQALLRSRRKLSAARGQITKLRKKLERE